MSCSSGGASVIGPEKTRQKLIDVVDDLRGRILDGLRKVSRSSSATLEQLGKIRPRSHGRGDVGRGELRSLGNPGLGNRSGVLLSPAQAGRYSGGSLLAGEFSFLHSGPAISIPHANWGPDSRTAYIYTPTGSDNYPLRIFKLDPFTGNRKFLKEISRIR